MKTFTSIEPLEPRIAPASLTFTDGDGDNVVITTTGAGTLTLGVNVIVTAGQLLRLDLTDEAFQGANVSIVATRAPDAGGDGRVNVGYINALGRDLGAVLVDGDLGRIEAGDPAAPARACKSLTVQSLGRLGLVTQGGAGDLVSDFDGRLGKLTVKGEVKDAGVGAGSIGSVFVGGSLVGGAGNDSALIFSSGDMGLVKVGGDLVGGAGNVSGAIVSFGAIAGVTVGGSVLGGRNASTGDPELGSGVIVARGKLGPVKIGRDVRGDFGEFSGAIYSDTQIVSVNIGGSLLGGGKRNSGAIITEGLCGPVTINGDMVGGFGPGSGTISTTQDIASVTVGGSLIAGDGNGSATIISVQGALGPVKIGGNIEGGDGSFAGLVSGATRIDSVRVGGSVLGGNGMGSGGIEGFAAIGPVRIGGDIRGGEGSVTGYINAATTLGAVTLGGSLIGGDGMTDSGNIASGGAMGFVKIGGDIIAGSASQSGQVDSGGTLAGVRLGGSLVGDSFRHGASGASNNGGQILSVGAMGPVKIAGDVIGGLASQSGRIVSMSTIASVTIGGSLIGGNSFFSGEIVSTGAMGPVKIGGDIRGNTGSAVGAQVVETGYIQGQRIASLFVGGSIRAGVDATSGVPDKAGSVRAVDDIGPIVIKGSLLGSASTDGDSADGDFSPAIISARGEVGIGFTARNDVAIESIKIKGRVEQALILAGFSTLLASQNADAQIGPIVIGDLIASSIVAGVESGGLIFGTADFKMAGPGVKDSLDANGALSKIASITIKGSVFGTAGTNDLATFAIVAQRLGALTLGGTTIPLNPGASNDPIGLATKLGATRGATTDGFDFHAFEV